MSSEKVDKLAFFCVFRLQNPKYGPIGVKFGRV